MGRKVETYSFEKGEHTDFNPEMQPKGTYRHGLNWVRDKNGQLIAERGTTKIQDLPINLEIIGNFNLEGDLILLLVNSTSTISEIGILDKQNIYTPYISNRSGSNAPLQLTTNKLNFSFSSPIDITARKLFNGNRVIYFVDGINDNRRLNLDNLPNEIRFEEDITLQLVYKIPVITLDSFINGSLPTGIYQLGIRYLTKGGQATSVGILTDTIKIIDDNSNSSRKNIDGASPQSTSSQGIKLIIENLDENYPFIEIIAITYLTTANIPSYKVIGRKERTSSSLIFNYINVNQNLQNLIEEDIIIQPNIYKTAKHIEQKDGILFLSNLTSSLISENFQDVANNIEVKYFIKEIDFNETIDVKVDGEDFEFSTHPTIGVVSNFTINTAITDENDGGILKEDYKNTLLSSIAVGYSRDEVISLALVPIFKNGTTGFAYHIPAKSTVENEANVSTKILGSYISNEPYITGKGLPSGNIRHHKTPNVAQEPITKITNLGEVEKIRILGLKLENINFPPEIKDKLQGYYIVRQRRDTAQNTRMVAQGFSKGLFKLDSFVTTIPSYGRMAMKDLFASSGTLEVVDGSNGDQKLFSFYAPDIIHNLVTDINITEYRQYDNNKYIANRKFDSRGNANEVDTIQVFSYLDLSKRFSNSSSYERATLINNFFEIPAFNNLKDEIATKRIHKPSQRSFSLPFGDINLYLSSKNNGHIILSALTGNLEGWSSNSFNPNLTHEEYNGNSAEDIFTVFEEEPIIGIKTLLNIISNQYGTLETASYIQCGKVIFGLDNKTIDNITLGEDEVEVFGGDTYINKYGLVMNEAPGVGDGDLLESQVLLYFFLESRGNYNYKHIEQNEDSTTSLPYYPKNRVIFSTSNPLGLLNYSAKFGHSSGYNKQYSFENIVRTFISEPLLFENETNFFTRTIRSQQTTEGEISDNFRIFLPNDFQDIPKDKGSITNTFVWNNFFYIHTERGLFKAYVNTREQLITDISQITIGNGGVFQQLPTELFDIEGGYLGTTSKWASIVTPFAYYFIVNHRGKVFAFTDIFQEISDLGKFDFFRKNIEESVESPLENLGYIAGFDYFNSRYILSKLHENSFTYSYYTKLASWTGKHSYLANWFINRDKDFILYDKETLYTLNTGEVGKYFEDNYSNLEIQLSLNLPIVSKVYDNLHIGSRVRNLVDKRIKPFDFFNKLQCKNLDQNTGLIELIVSQDINPTLTNSQKKVSYKSREYRVYIPKDSVIDGLLDIENISNLNIDKLFKGRLISEFCLLDLIKDNRIENNELVLDYIKLFYRDQKI